MDPLLTPRFPKAPIKEQTLEEVRQGLLRDANAPGISFATAQHYRKLAELVHLQMKKTG